MKLDRHRKAELFSKTISCEICNGNDWKYIYSFPEASTEMECKECKNRRLIVKEEKDQIILSLKGK